MALLTPNDPTAFTAITEANTQKAIDQNNQLTALFKTIQNRRESRGTNYTTRRDATRDTLRVRPRVQAISRTA